MCACSTIQRGSMQPRRFDACIYLTFHDLCTRMIPRRFARRKSSELRHAATLSSAEVMIKSGEEKA